MHQMSLTRSWYAFKIPAFLCVAATIGCGALDISNFSHNLSSFAKVRRHLHVHDTLVSDRTSRYESMPKRLSLPTSSSDWAIQGKGLPTLVVMFMAIGTAGLKCLTETHPVGSTSMLDIINDSSYFRFLRLDTKFRPSIRRALNRRLLDFIGVMLFCSASSIDLGQ